MVIPRLGVLGTFLYVEGIWSYQLRLVVSRTGS